MNRKRFVLFALLSLFFLAGCGVRQADIAPPSGKTPVPEATGEGSSAAIEGSTPPAEAVLASTPTPAAVPATGTSPVPPTDLCREYLPLSVLQGEAKAEAVATSYRCHGASIDSTGRSPSTSPDWVVQRDTPIHLQLAVEQRPTAIEVRLYPGAGISASFLRWPEEFPIRIEAADMSQPEPGTRFQYLPQAPEGPYSLVVHIAWGEEVEVFYALSFTLEDAAPTRAAARATPKPTATPTRAAVVRATPRPTATPTPASLALLPGQTPDEVKLDVVQQIGGHSLAVAVEQGRVYLGIGPRLVVLDALTPLAESPSLGQSEVLPGIVQDVTLVNNLAYVAAGNAGLILLDVADPPNT
ncbi:MAG: hypothetical protein JSV36_12995, partial [Anaerolineae bacterium]